MEVGRIILLDEPENLFHWAESLVGRERILRMSYPENPENLVPEVFSLIQRSIWYSIILMINAQNLTLFPYFP